jgi:MFS transporter, ACDE family, multidrug resistance protein
VRRNAVLTLFVARAVYAFSWYNVGAVLPLLGSGLGIDTAELGIVLGSFLLGAAVFQLPAGLASMRWGNRRVSLAALGVMGAFALASGFSPDWYVLAALRFGAGAGAAFFFAPALGLVAAYYPPGTRGPIIGIYNAGFSAGAAAGLFFGALLGAAYGWPTALAVGGVGLLAIAGVAAAILPKPAAPPTTRTFAELVAAAAPVLRSRGLWALALAITGLWAVYYIVAQYFVDFASTAHAEWSLAFAAALPTVMIVLEIVGGPVGGWLGERYRDMRTALLLFGVPSAAVVILLPFLPLAGLVAIFVFLGFADGVVFAVLYLVPTYHPEARGEGLSLALALINCIQILAGSALAIAFGFIAADLGYTDAWIFAGCIGVVPLPLLWWVRGARGGVNPAEPDVDDRPTAKSRASVDGPPPSTIGGD